MFLRTQVGSLPDRRLADSLDSLDRRKEPRSQVVTVDFGATPTTTATGTVSGLSWLTFDQSIVLGLTSQEQVTANLFVAAISVEPGRGFTIVAKSLSNLAGVQRLSMVVV